MEKIVRVNGIIISVILASLVLINTPQVFSNEPPQREFSGAEGARFEKDVQEALEKLDQKQDASVDLDALEEVAKEEAKKDETKFIVRDVQISGAENIPADELQIYVEGLIRDDVTITGVRNVAQDIKNHYRRRGFVAAYAYVPQQDITDGILEIKVVEGKLGSIAITGNKYYSEKTLRRHIFLTPGEAVTYKDLRKSLARLNKHPDLQSRGFLKPGDELMTTNLAVEVEDRRPIHLGVDINNSGTKLTGRERVGISASHNNLTGHLDRLNGRFEISEGSYSILGNYEVPIIPRWGTELGLTYQHTSTDLEGDFSVLNAEGDVDAFGIYIDQPAYESKFLDVTFRFGFDYKDVEERLLEQVTGKDKIRRLNLGINFEETDRYGKTFWPNTFHWGIDWLDASAKTDENLTRASTGAPYFIYRSSLDRYLFLPYDLMVVLRASTQITGDKLMPAEQFQIGGVNSVRGYPQGEYLGDYGLTTSVEGLIPVYIIPKSWKLPWFEESIRDQIKLLAFADYGVAELRQSLPGEDDRRELAGAGLGVRVRLIDKIYSRVSWASPIGRDPSDGSDDAFYYTVGMELI